MELANNSAAEGMTKFMNDRASEGWSFEREIEAVVLSSEGGNITSAPLLLFSREE
ncbi:hypothetical protein [Magnetospira sp. QH-2]|uniref:hypothetical protein n=1 Tax=Magnetospira sp. (strain QH-2) TaxID=1288970 RepID=UPI00130E9DCE|nr:hypothetical protein [Magnetospira sp. QH-2]